MGGSLFCGASRRLPGGAGVAEASVPGARCLELPPSASGSDLAAAGALRERPRKLVVGATWRPHSARTEVCEPGFFINFTRERTEGEAGTRGSAGGAARANR